MVKRNYIDSSWETEFETVPDVTDATLTASTAYHCAICTQKNCVGGYCGSYR